MVCFHKTLIVNGKCFDVCVVERNQEFFLFIDGVLSDPTGSTSMDNIILDCRGIYE